MDAEKFASAGGVACTGMFAKALASAARNGRMADLTPEDITEAKKNASHPVIGVLYSLRDDWICLKNSLENSKEERAAERQVLYIEATKKLESALGERNFGLTHNDLVSIWSVLMSDGEVSRETNISSTKSLGRLRAPTRRRKSARRSGRASSGGSLTFPPRTTRRRWRWDWMA